jgi:putative protease
LTGVIARLGRLRLLALPPSPEGGGIHAAKIAWFVRLRWLAVVGMVSFPLFGRYVFGLRYALWPFMATGAFLFTYNVALYLWSRKILKGADQERRARRHSNVQIAADLFTLTLVIYLGGGIANPFVLYYVFHVVVAAMLLPWKHVLIQTAVACFLLSGAALMEYWELLPHAEAGNIFATDVRADRKTVVVALFAFTSTMFVLAFFVKSVAERLREREEDLVLANAKLAEQDRAKSLYVMRVAHDIRSPAATVASCLAVVTHGMAGDVPEKALDMIRRAKRRAEFVARLVEDLLDLSRIRAARELPKGALRLEPLVREVVEQESALAREKEITLEVAINEKSVSVEGNPKTMHELLANLVSNAIKYTPIRGHVRVAARGEGDQIRVEVSDNGVGIPAADLPHIFDEFYRAENVRQEAMESTGFGLAIAQEIVKAHRGKIAVESTEGQGTTFVVTLPVGAEVGLASDRCLRLSSPAGTLEALKAAVEAGADAVYFGFRTASNLRNIPGLNFSVDEARQGVRLAHEAGARAYVTVNTYPTDDLLPVCLAAVDDAVSIGADAVVATDLAVLDYACSKYPELDIRLSCQAGAADTDSIGFYRERFGICGVILPRVLSLAEITEIRESTDIELEVFGFGSLCANYEGRCYLSSYITGVSANNVGACAPAEMIELEEGSSGGTLVKLAGVLIDIQEPGVARPLPTPCKGLYRNGATGQLCRAFQEPASLNAMPLLRELAEAGVNAIKMEGRQRSETYVRDVTAAWRGAIDRLGSESKESTLEAARRLAGLVEWGECTLGCLAERT